MTDMTKKVDLMYLNDREELEPLEIIPNFPEEIIVEGLEMICDSFDIRSEQVSRLRKEDRIFELYETVRVSGWHDDMELERLRMALEEKLNRRIEDKEFALIHTVEDLIQYLHSYLTQIEQSADVTREEYPPLRLTRMSTAIRCTKIGEGGLRSKKPVS